MNQERLERKCDEEPESDRGPVIHKNKEEKKQVTSEEVIQMMEKHEAYQKMITSMAGGSETEAGQKL